MNNFLKILFLLTLLTFTYNQIYSQNLIDTIQPSYLYSWGASGTNPFATMYVYDRPTKKYFLRHLNGKKDSLNYFNGQMSIYYASLVNTIEITDYRLNDFSTFFACDFEKDVLFRNLDFRNGFVLESCLFFGKVILGPLVNIDSFCNKFNEYGQLRIYNSTFEKPLLMHSNRICYSIIENTNFKSNLEIMVGQSSHFVIKNCNFDKSIIINRLSIDSVLNFNGNKIDGSVKFSDCNLPYYLNFQGVKCNGTIDLLSNKFPSNTKSKINLTDSDIQNLKIQMDQFDLYFPDSTSSEIINGTYERLLENFKNNGFQESYEKLDIKHREWKAYSGNIFLVFSFVIQNWWWEFGYSKGRVVLNTFLIFAFFIIITYFKINKLQTSVYPIGIITKDIEKNKKKSNSVLYKVKISIFYVAIIFFGIKFNFDKLTEINHNAYYLLSMYITGLFCTIFILNYIFTR